MEPNDVDINEVYDKIIKTLKEIETLNKEKKEKEDCILKYNLMLENIKSITEDHHFNVLRIRNNHGLTAIEYETFNPYGYNSLIKIYDEWYFTTYFIQYDMIFYEKKEPIAINHFIDCMDVGFCSGWNLLELKPALHQAWRKSPEKIKFWLYEMKKNLTVHEPDTNFEQQIIDNNRKILQDAGILSFEIKLMES